MKKIIITILLLAISFGSYCKPTKVEDPPKVHQLLKVVVKNRRNLA